MTFFELPIALHYSVVFSFPTFRCLDLDDLYAADQFVAFVLHVVVLFFVEVKISQHLLLSVTSS